jgi:diguanylate cyclase (GGDEF)-like protein
MELRIYLNILARRWWLILIVTLAVGLAALLYSLNLTELYEGHASYILRPHSALVVDDSTVRAIDTLSRRIEIATTYAEVAGSDLIKNRAAERLGLTHDDSTGLLITGRVIPGTNVLELSIRGPSRQLVGQFAEAVSLEFVAYVNGLYDVFELGVLDEPRVARTPVGPDTKIILGGSIVAGIALGSVLALLAQYWQIIATEKKHFDIVDPDTGTFNRAYLMLRLKEEMSRAKHNESPFSLALLSLIYPPSADTWTTQYKADMLRRFISYVGAQLREEDILCRFEATQFALLLPALPLGQARDLLTGVEDRFGTGVFDAADGRQETLRFAAGISSFSNQDSVDELLGQAKQALHEASDSDDIRITLFQGDRKAIAAGA